MQRFFLCLGALLALLSPAEARLTPKSAPLALPPGPGYAHMTKLSRDSLTRCAGEFRLHRIRFRITSAWRSRAAQARLYSHRRRNRYPVARPGTSDHERGMAIDIVFFSRASESSGRKTLLHHSWGQPVPHDPVHWVHCPCFIQAHPRQKHHCHSDKE